MPRMASPIYVRLAIKLHDQEYCQYVLHAADVAEFDLESAPLHDHAQTKPWRVTLVETGEATQTGGRLRTEPGCATRTPSA